MPPLAMRMKIGKYLICTTAILGMVACQQQDQQQIVEQPVTSVVRPAPKPAPKPKSAPRPLVKVDNSPVQQVANPTRLRPLGRKVSHVPVKGKYVALTFDDGPHPSLTRKALDILNRHGAKGTFFMLGENVARYKSVVASAAAAGHELGVHTWSHIKMTSSARSRVDREVSRTQNLIARISGVYPRVMRPPYGATNATLVNHMYDRYGMASILWDVDTRDWCKPGVSKVVNKAVNDARPGSIILVHDIHASTISALESIVTGLQSRGYKLVTVSQLMQIAKKEAADAAAAKAAEEAAAKAAAEAAGAQQALQDIQQAEAAAAQQGNMQPVVTPEQLTPPQIQPQTEETAPALKLENFMLN